MISTADSITKKEYLWIILVCLLSLLIPAVLTHVRTGVYEEKQGKANEFDAYCLSGTHDLSQWTKYVLQYKNPKDFLFPNEKEGFSLFRYLQNDTMQDILPEYRPFYEAAFARPGMKEQPPAIVLPDFPKPELYDEIPRIPVYPDLPAVQYPAVFSADGTYLAHLDLDLSQWRLGRNPLVFSVITPQLPDLPRHAFLENPTGNRQMNLDLTALINQKLMTPEFQFHGEKLYLHFAPFTLKREEQK